MINKVINYVWVGGKPMPKKLKDIIHSNAEILGSGWKYKIWTEKDFDIDSNPFTSYWYKKGQWAFVADYIRAFAVYSTGGFYLDTDVILKKSLSNFVGYKYVASRTNVVWNTMSFFGAEEKSPILKKYMEVISNGKMIRKPPRIMSTHIHTYSLNVFIDIPDENNNFVLDGIIIMNEGAFQVELKGIENFALHEHHDNWKGNSNLEVSKYYFKKQKFYQNLTGSKINKEKRKKAKIFKKITAAIHK